MKAEDLFCAIYRALLKCNSPSSWTFYLRCSSTSILNISRSSSSFFNQALLCWLSCRYSKVGSFHSHKLLDWLVELEPADVGRAPVRRSGRTCGTDIRAEGSMVLSLSGFASRCTTGEAGKGARGSCGERRARGDGNSDSSFWHGLARVCRKRADQSDR